MSAVRLDAADLLARTVTPRHCVAVARAWLLDCDWAEGDDAREEIELLGAAGIVGAIERHYPGGWRAFAEIEQCWSGRTPRERNAS